MNKLVEEFLKEKANAADITTKGTFDWKGGDETPNGYIDSAAKFIMKNHNDVFEAMRKDGDSEDIGNSDLTIGTKGKEPGTGKPDVSVDVKVNGKPVGYVDFGQKKYIKENLVKDFLGI